MRTHYYRGTTACHLKFPQSCVSVTGHPGARWRWPPLNMAKAAKRPETKRKSQSRSSGSQMATKRTEHISRRLRLRALSRLLGDALSESKDLGLVDLDKLLSAAALAVSDEINNVKVLSPKTTISRERPPPKS